MLKENCFVGSRIRALCDAEGIYTTKNVTGIIKKICTDACIVCFDIDVGGWDDEDFDINDNRGVYIGYDEIELINS